MMTVTEPIYNADGDDVTRYVTKLKHLMNLAENASCDEEAEAAQAKAFEFMEKYGLDASMIAKTESARAEERNCVVIETSGIYARQLRNLAAGIAQAVAGAYPLVGGKNTRQYVYVYGYESATFTVQVLYASLALQAQSALKSAWTAALRDEPWLRSYSAMEKFVWKRTFLIGFNVAVTGRLQLARERTVKAAAAAGIVGAEVALVDRDQAIRTWADTFATGEAKKSRALNYDYDGLRAGGDAGRRASLGSDASVTGSSTRALH
jgi:hypothetical protein